MFNRLIQQFKQTSLRRLTSRDAYQKWAEDYPPTPHNRLMEIEQDAMLSLMPAVEGQRVLDLACGTGRYGLIAEDHGAQDVIGIDDSLAMLTKASLSNCIAGSMTQIPFADACVDIILCGLAVGHLPDLIMVLEEIARVLDKDGYALISDFHPFQYLSGARRTFQSGNEVYEVEHYPHLYQTWHEVCQTCGLRIDDIIEPPIPEQSMPVVIVYRLVKI